MFKYFGSKLNLTTAYPPPVFDTVIEPFAGSAAYAVAHRHVDRVVLVERDAAVVALWRRLLAMTADQIRQLPDPVAGTTSSDLLVAFASGRTTRDTPPTFIVSPRMAQRFRPMVNRIASVVDECRHFEVVEGDYTDAPDVQATWFIDPPYAPTPGGRWDRARGGRYRHNNASLDYADLATWCTSRSGQVIVCEQDGSDWLPWNGQVSARDGAHGGYQEVWWTNMPDPRPRQQSLL